MCQFLFIHGDDDKLVPTYMINKLYEANAGIKDKLNNKKCRSYWINV